MLPYKKTTLACLVALASGQGFAQNAEETPTTQKANNAVIEEVVVTAQKREQDLQDTPIAIAAFNKQAIEDQKVSDITDVTATTPNVQIAPSPGGSTGATVAIRGAASINPAVTWEPSVGIYVDGVFVAKNVGGLFDVAELERVEVLRGPQGTLYGKNTTGGAINLITRKPAEEFGGHIKLGAGNYGYTELGATVDSGRVGDMARFMVSYKKRDRDGFYDNNVQPLPNGEPLDYTVDEFKKLDSQAGLVSGVFDLSDTVELSYTYDWAERDNTVAYGQPEDLQANGELPKPEREDEGNLNGAGFDTSESSGHNLQITWDISDSLVFKSITSHRKMEFHDLNDYDGTPYTGFHAERDVDHKQSSQEFQLIGETNSISYVVGLYYFTDEANARNPYTYGPTPATVIRNFYGAESHSYAVFGQADWYISPSWTLTVGGRYTQEKKDAYVNHPDTAFSPVPPFSPIPSYSSEADETWNKFSPMAVLSYGVNENVTTYAKISQGWRAGGFNGEAASAALATEPYDEETTLSYELGMKAKWFENRLQTNVAIFQNDIDDMQLSAYDFTTGYSKIENAGKARVRGFELETLLAISYGLTAFFNYGYLDGEYRELTNPVFGDVNPITGNRYKDESVFAYTPKNKASVGLEYVGDVGFAEIRVRGDYSYVDEQDFFRDVGSAAVTHSDDYTLFNARVALVNIGLGGVQTLDLALWGKNLTDEEYRLNGIPAGATTGLNYYGDPRTYGLDVTYNF